MLVKVNETGCVSTWETKKTSIDSILNKYVEKSDETGYNICSIEILDRNHATIIMEIENSIPEADIEIISETKTKKGAHTNAKKKNRRYASLRKTQTARDGLHIDEHFINGTVVKRRHNKMYRDYKNTKHTVPRRTIKTENKKILNSDFDNYSLNGNYYHKKILCDF